MAERLKVKLLDSDKLVDLVAGPDAYRDIPRLLDTIEVCCVDLDAKLNTRRSGRIQQHLLCATNCICDSGVQHAQQYHDL